RGALLLAGDQHVDHAVGGLDAGRADVVGRVHAEPAALDHRGAAHADRRVGGGDDDVAAAQQGGVAGGAAAGGHADHRDQAGQPGELEERRDVEAGAEVVGVARATAAALGEQHDRQPALVREAEHAVELLVVHVALGPGEHGVVVGRDHAAGAAVAEQLA